MLTIAFIAILVFAAIVLLTVSFGREEKAPSMRPESRLRNSIDDKVRARLRKAGYINVEPAFYYLANALVVGGVALLLLILSRGIILPLASVPMTMMVIWLWLKQKQRSYIKRADEEMVPFLNRVQTAVSAGSSIQNAFLEAMQGTRLMKEALHDEMRAIAMNEPLTKALRESVPKFPVRAWESFVRHVTMQVERGGDIEGILASSVEQIQGMIKLQATLKADFAEAKREQLIIILMAAGALIFLNVMMAGVVIDMFSSIFGIVGFSLGMFFIVGGVWYGQKTIQEIEERINS